MTYAALSMTGMIGPQVAMSMSEAPPAWPYGRSPSSASLLAARFLYTRPALWRSKLELPSCFRWHSMLAQNSQSFQQSYDKEHHSCNMAWPIFFKSNQIKSISAQSNTQPKKLNGIEINKYVTYMHFVFFFIMGHLRSLWGGPMGCSGLCNLAESDFL